MCIKYGGDAQFKKDRVYFYISAACLHVYHTLQRASYTASLKHEQSVGETRPLNFSPFSRFLK
jgi:hypothetical protein